MIASSIFNLRRLSSPVGALIIVVLGLAAVDATLRAVCGPDPAWLPPQFGLRYFPEFGSRIVAVEKMEHSGQVQPQKLVVAIGVSTTLFGLDGPELTSHDPHGRKWLVLGATGNSFRTLRIYSQVLLDSSLHPAIVVLGLHPWMLHSEVRDLPDSRFAAYADNYSWLFDNYKSLEEEKTLLFYRGDADVRHIFRLPMSDTYDPVANPWSVNEPVYEGPRVAQRYLDIQWQGFQRYLNEAHFKSNQAEIDAFTGLVHDLRGQGARVICVLLPQSSEFRSLHIPSASREFEAEAEKESLEVIDLRNSMPDNCFYDHSHLNEQGRERLSAKLPALLP